MRIPANSNVHAVLDRRGLVKRGRQRRCNKAIGTSLSARTLPNDLWCADFKGEFKLGDKTWCYPLTVTDHASRCVLMAEAHPNTREVNALDAFERLFKERGLPRTIRADNGLPFASPNGLYNPAKLSVYWLRLGINLERIKPGHPQHCVWFAIGSRTIEQGRHERMHLTLKKETTKPPGMNALQQQARFDDFVDEFNTERPHQTLSMKCPDDVYTPSQRPYQGLPDVTYETHERDIIVTACGRICMHREKINISTCLTGQRPGLSEVDDGVWSVSFMHHDLGYIDLEQKLCRL